MRFVVLAAGVGSRLRPLTEERPKCLVPVGGVSILERLLRQAEDTGAFEEAVLITGYRAKQIQAFAADWNASREMPAHIVHNDAYEQTNNGYSLLCAADKLSDGYVLADGDLVMDPCIIARMASLNRSAFAVDQNRQLDAEAMKFRLNSEGRIVELDKSIPVEQAHGESIGLCFVASEDVSEVVRRLRGLVDRGLTEEYYERAYQEMITGGWKPDVVNVGDLAWTEIDDHEDLSRASRIFANQ